MALRIIDNVLTFDANVINYYFIQKNDHKLPEGLNVNRMMEFSSLIIEKYPLAVNKYIESEYKNVIGHELAKNWLKERLQEDLAFEIPSIRLAKKIRTNLIKEYGFKINSADMRYLETCLNTILKSLVTENTKDFMKKNRAKKKRSMPSYLKKELCIKIFTIDEFCEEYAI